MNCNCSVSCYIVLYKPNFADQFDKAAHVQYCHNGEVITLPELPAPLVTQKLRLGDSELYQESVQKIQ